MGQHNRIPSNYLTPPTMRLLFVVSVLICVAGIVAALSSEEDEQNMVLSKGYFEILYEIYAKLRQLRHEVACSTTVKELIELLGLPDLLENVVIVARGWVCDNVWDN